MKSQEAGLWWGRVCLVKYTHVSKPGPVPAGGNGLVCSFINQGRQPSVFATRPQTKDCAAHNRSQSLEVPATGANAAACQSAREMFG